MVIAEEQAAMLAFLHRDVAWAELADRGAGFDEARQAGELPRFAVVEMSMSTRFEQRQQVVLRDVDPQVHGVGDDELRARHLIENVALQIRPMFASST
jgi:hypothetical protein